MSKPPIPVKNDAAEYMDLSSGADVVEALIDAEVSECFEANCLIRSISATLKTRQLFRSLSTSLTLPLMSQRLSVTADTPIAWAA